jgi:hypothetical protein
MTESDGRGGIRRDGDERGRGDDAARSADIVDARLVAAEEGYPVAGPDARPAETAAMG